MASQEKQDAMMGLDIIPGTEVLVDAESTSRVKHSQGSDIVLIPQPSSNLDDPLNWSTTWKYTVVLVQFAFTFVAVEAALSVAPMFPLLAEEFHLDQTQLNLLSGACILGQAYANFIIVPYSNIFGRRQACLTCAVLIILTEVWEALASDYKSLLAARVLNGLVSAVSESVMVQVINDVFFSHQRGQWMGIYFMTYFVGIYLGGIIAGNIAEHHGWRSFFWLSVGLSGFNLLTLLFLFPETKYKRTMAAMEAVPELADSSSGNPNAKGDVSEEVQSRDSDLPAQATLQTSLVGQGRPSKRQFHLWRKPDSDWTKHLVHDIFTPVRIFFYPIILWTGFVAGGAININLYYILTEAEVLAAPPYNFSESALGYSNFAFLVGGLLGLVSGGPLSDYITRRSARRNHGLREAEMRLPSLIPFVCITIISLVVGGIALQRQWAWPVLLVVGWAGAGMTVTTIPSIVVAYAIDAYKPLAGEIMVVVTVVKNTFGFSMSYWIPSLAKQSGLLTPAMLQFALAMAPLALTPLVYFYGKNLRKLTKNSYVHKLSEH